MGAYSVLSLALWTSRLLSILHAESSAIIAFAGFFIAGLHTLRPVNRTLPIHSLFAGHVLLLLIPWFLLTVSLLWVPNCGYWTGFTLFILFAVPSVVLGVSIGTWLRTWRMKWKRILFVALGLLIVVGGVAYDLGLHPQFYTLNHVFGAFLGPVYEDALHVRPGLFVFRFLTLLWASLFVVLGLRRELEASGDVPGPARSRSMVSVIGISVAIAGIYLLSSFLGLNTTYRKIEATLGSVARSTNFDIHYDARIVDERRLERIIADHEFEYARLCTLLGIEPSLRVHSYLYPTVRGKIELTGAGVTDVAPVWLRRPQIHLLLDSYPTTVSHELVHVLSREFGLPVVRASLLVGLVEGLAVALQAPDGRPSVHEQVAVAMRGRVGSIDVGLESGAAQELVGMLDPVSFWSGRGAVSYTMTGSFVRYLLDTYGARGVREAYATGNFVGGFGRPLSELAQEWDAFLRRLPLVSIGSFELVLRRFTIPSLFEKRCPHFLPRHVAEYRKARDFLALRDTLSTVHHLERALDEEARYAPALALWSRLSLNRGDAAAVLRRMTGVHDSLYTPAIHLYYGDALATNGDYGAALVQYKAAESKLPQYERDARVMVLLRKRLSGTSEGMRILYAHTGAQMDASIPSSHRIAYALRLAEQDRAAEAADLLVGSDWNEWPELSIGQRMLVRRTVDQWAARLYHRAGQPEDAERMYTYSLDAARTVGDLNQVAYIEHQIRRVRWRG